MTNRKDRRAAERAKRRARGQTVHNPGAEPIVQKMTRGDLYRALEVDAAVAMLGKDATRQEGLETLTRLAQEGNAAAMYNLAVEKFKGNAVAFDYEEANRLCLRVSALDGIDPVLRALAFSVLGDSAQQGRGCPINHTLALERYIHGARLGGPEAAFNAGLYFHGKIEGGGVPMNFEKAAEFYEIAARHGHLHAQTNLGVLHYAGALKRSDQRRGYELLQRSIAAGDAVASKSLRDIDEALGRRDIGNDDAGSDERAAGALIGNARNLPWIARRLRQLRGCEWLQEVHPEHLPKFLVGPMAVAGWIWRDRPDLLKRDRLRIAVAAGEYDLVAGGAFWALINAALGKQDGWAQVQLVAPRTAKVLLDDLGVEYRQRGGVSIVRSEEIGQLPAEEQSKWDMAFLPSAHTCGLVVAFGKDDQSLWPLMEGGGTIVMGLRYQWETWISEGIAAACRASLTISENPLHGALLDGADDECVYLVAASGAVMPSDREAFVNELGMLEEITDFAERFAETWGHDDDIEDFREWGIKAVTKASLDKDDLYVALPLGFRERLADGKIYRFENDVRTVAMETRVDARTRDPESIPSTTWAGRVWWTCELWSKALEPEYLNTLGGSLEQSGGITFQEERALMTEALTKSGMDAERAQFVMEAITGSAPYSPSRDERRLFQALADGGPQAALSLVRANRALANARDEQRRPLVLALGELRHKEAMSEAVHLGADINATDAGHRPVVVQLAQNSTTEIVERALDLGADIDAQDPMGWTALQIALVMAKWEMAGMLVDRKASTTLGADQRRSPRQLVSGSYTRTMRDLEEQSRDLARSTGVDMVAAMKKRGMGNDPANAPEWLKQKILAA